MNRVPRKSSVRIVRYIGDPHFIFADELFKSFLKGNRLQGGIKGVFIGFSQKIRNWNLQIICDFNDWFRIRYDSVAGYLGNGIGTDPDACGKFGVAAMSTIYAVRKYWTCKIPQDMVNILWDFTIYSVFCGSRRGSERKGFNCWNFMIFWKSWFWTRVIYK